MVPKVPLSLPILLGLCVSNEMSADGSVALRAHCRIRPVSLVHCYAYTYLLILILSVAHKAVSRAQYWHYLSLTLPMHSLIVFNSGVFMMAVKQRCNCCQQDEGIATLTESTELSEECRKKKERVPLWVAGRYLQARWHVSCGGYWCPAGTIMGLCVLAVLPLADCCNSIMDVQMGL